MDRHTCWGEAVSTRFLLRRPEPDASLQGVDSAWRCCVCCRHFSKRSCRKLQIHIWLFPKSIFPCKIIMLLLKICVAPKPRYRQLCHRWQASNINVNGSTCPVESTIVQNYTVIRIYQVIHYQVVLCDCRLQSLRQYHFTKTKGNCPSHVGVESFDATFARK